MIPALASLWVDDEGTCPVCRPLLMTQALACPWVDDGGTCPVGGRVLKLRGAELSLLTCPC